MNLQHTFIVNFPCKFTIVNFFIRRGGEPGASLSYILRCRNSNFWAFFQTKDKEPLTAFCTNTCTLDFMLYFYIVYFYIKPNTIIIRLKLTFLFLPFINIYKVNTYGLPPFLSTIIFPP